VEGDIEVETMPESDDSSRDKFENRARHSKINSFSKS